MNQWTDEELMLVLHLYFVVSDKGFTDSYTIRKYNEMMNEYTGNNRTYGSIMLRLGNYKYLDKGVGLSNTGYPAKRIWNLYHNQRNELKKIYEKMIQSI